MIRVSPQTMSRFKSLRSRKSQSGRSSLTRSSCSTRAVLGGGPRSVRAAPRRSATRGRATWPKSHEWDVAMRDGLENEPPYYEPGRRVSHCLTPTWRRLGGRPRRSHRARAGQAPSCPRRLTDGFNVQEPILHHRRPDPHGSRFPIHVRVEPPEGGLSVPSVVQCEQIRTVSYRRLRAIAGRSVRQPCRRSKSALRRLLDL